MTAASGTQLGTGPAQRVWQRGLPWAALALGAVVYFAGLDSPHIPKNGDEYPYAHITRLTAANGHLLPLQSQVEHMRNTKPPMLFWQGIVTTDWGTHWTWWRLRYPSVLYSLLTAGLAMLLAQRISGQARTGAVAALAFLAFFSTYRFGRPFLTDPGLVFWLFLPFFTLLYGRPRSFDSPLAVPALLGVQLGVGLLYKSFALVGPAGLAMALWYLLYRDGSLKAFLIRDTGKLVLIGVTALLVFGLWFALDPDPRAVWREFVVGENLGKFDSKSTGYLGKLLWGSSSLWSLLAAFFGNAGLLAFPMVGLVVAAFRDRRQMGLEKRLLWVWVLVMLVVFSLPSQRSGRYLMPVMPVVAVLLALEWDRMGRGLCLMSLVGAGLAVAILAGLAWMLDRQVSGPAMYGWPYWLLLIAVGALVVVGIVRPRQTRPFSLVAALLVYGVFSAFLSPLAGPLGRYSPETIAEVAGRSVWVPCRFKASDEGHRFLIPGADVHGYSAGLNLTLDQLARRYPLFAAQVPMTESLETAVSEHCPGCRMLGQRLDLRSRHTGQELRAMFLEGKLFELLFVREILIESPHAPRDATQRWARDECH